MGAPAGAPTSLKSKDATMADLLQPTHLILVLGVALLVLGPKRLPGAGRALGQGLREFKGSLTAAQNHDSEASSHVLSSEDETETP